MRSPRVRLYIRIRVQGKDAYAEPVYNRNRTLRQGYALVDGKAEHHPEGIYYLRYAHSAGKRRWKAVGACADVAAIALQDTEHDLQAEALGRFNPAVATAFRPGEDPASAQSVCLSVCLSV